VGVLVDVNIEVGVTVEVAVGVPVGVKVAVLVAVGGTGVFVGVKVGPATTVPPPKSSRTALPALTNHKPMYPPLVAYVHPLASRDPSNVPFRYTSTMPFAFARAPN